MKSVWKRPHRVGVGVPHLGFLGLGEGNPGELSLLAHRLVRAKLVDLWT